VLNGFGNALPGVLRWVRWIFVHRWKCVKAKGVMPMREGNDL
jgi:hypothetical protein